MANIDHKTVKKNGHTKMRAVANLAETPAWHAKELNFSFEFAMLADTPF